LVYIGYGGDGDSSHHFEQNSSRSFSSKSEGSRANLGFQLLIAAYHIERWREIEISVTSISTRLVIVIECALCAIRHTIPLYNYD
jgi:hypothetical protein